MANDVFYIGLIIAIFISTGVVAPYLNDDFNHDAPQNSVTNLVNNVGEGSFGLTAIGIMVSVATMFFWTFGTLPLWLETIFVIIRIIFYILVYRSVRSGGG